MTKYVENAEQKERRRKDVADARKRLGVVAGPRLEVPS